MSDAPARIPLHDKDGAVVAYALVDVADGHLFQYHKWKLFAYGYGGRRTSRWDAATQRSKAFAVFIHRVVLGLPHGDPRQGDHINGDRLDCRRANLRIVSHAENAQNLTRLRSDNRSGYRGVSWHKGAGRWQAHAQIDGRCTYLGLFDDERSAARVAAVSREATMPGHIDHEGLLAEAV